MAAKDKNTPTDDKQYLVVGLGASAGGLDALKSFFHSLPDETGMAFIVIIHLAPKHKSNMAELLQMQTKLQVQQVNKKVAIKPDHVYVIPPNKLLLVGDNHLKLSKPEKKHGLATVDLFFRSLAKTKGKNSVAVILSGTGNDGTTGMKAIKQEGGLTMVQDPEEAQYAGMPQSAINNGLGDMVLPVGEMAQHLLQYRRSLPQPKLSDQKQVDRNTLQKIFTRLQSRTGHDFSSYKRSSILRRLERRIQVTGADDLKAYHQYLQENPKEIHELFKDLLISVTNFFRDEEAFEALENNIIPKLFEDKKQDDQLRVWVPGCATGEEAYSIAILLQEYAATQEAPPMMQVFASDIDQEALKIARKGRYPRSITTDVSEQRLERHFKKTGHEYQLNPSIQEMILFTPHDLLRDPPFSKQDLIACRNLLIYLNADLQTEVFNLFHYTLRKDKYLFLGQSDANYKALDLFSPVDKKHRIYRRSTKATSDLRLPQAPLQFKPKRLPLPVAEDRDKSFQAGDDGVPEMTRAKRDLGVEELHLKLLSKMYAPQSVLINDKYEILHSTANIKKYLEFTGGNPSYDILSMVKSPLRQPLRSLLFRLDKNKKDDPGPLHKRLRFEENGQTKKIELRVHPIDEKRVGEGLIQIVFREVEVKDVNDAKEEDGEVSDEENEIIKTLEEELEYTKEKIEIIMEEYETSNEELRASNEELQSMNEELQSSTEELETSQEELQSANEELKTVNDELVNKAEQLSKANDDLKNLMEATDLSLVFVDRNYCIQRFTGNATELFNLIGSDIGRPLAHVTHELDYDGLVDDVKQVHESLQKTRKVVRTKDDRWFIMRLRPFRSTEDTIKGVVISFVEYTDLKKAQGTIEAQQHQEVLATLGMYALEKDDLKAIMERTIDLSCVLLELNCAVIYSFDEEAGSLGIEMEAGCAEKHPPVELLDKWDIGHAFQQSSLTVVENYEDEQRFAISPFLKDKNMKSSLMIRIQEEEKTYGLLSFYSEKARTFSNNEKDFVRVAANIIGMAIQRHHSKEKLQKANAKLKKAMEESRRYQKDSLDNSLKERWNLGSYLHDNLAQLLASVKLKIDNCKEHANESDKELMQSFEELKETIDACIDDIRGLAHDFIPVDIDKDGLGNALRIFMRKTEQTYDVNCSLQTDEIIQNIRSVELASNLYYIVQEGVKNAVNHGKAQNIEVSFNRENGGLYISIKDDGVGLSQTTNNKDGRGLRIMRHRMDLMGGAFDLEEISDDGLSGTRITCSLPLEEITENGEEE